MVAEMRGMLTEAGIDEDDIRTERNFPVTRPLELAEDSIGGRSRRPERPPA